MDSTKQNIREPIIYENLDYDSSKFESIPETVMPCYVLDEQLLMGNLKKIEKLKQSVDCKVLLALKAFSTHSFFPLMRDYLDGVSASSANEVLLGEEEMHKDVHFYSPSLTLRDLNVIKPKVSHIVYNSFSQWNRFKYSFADSPHIKQGIRLNLEHSESSVDSYNTSKEFSRFGVALSEFDRSRFAGISGLHIHNLCGSNSDSVERNLEILDKKYSEELKQISWLNLGGGHLFTHADYNVDRLCEALKSFRDKYDLEIIFEPGEAIVYNTGFLVCEVVDIMKNKKPIAIVNVSAVNHMPDVMEIPYAPHILSSDLANEKEHSYIIGTNTCLSLDEIGEYSFDKPLEVGQRLVFSDRAQYTMVRSSHFNGIKHPSIAIKRLNGQIDIVKEFGYLDYKNSLS